MTFTSASSKSNKSSEMKRKNIDERCYYWNNKDKSALPTLYSPEREFCGGQNATKHTIDSRNSSETRPLISVRPNVFISDDLSGYGRECGVVVWVCRFALLTASALRICVFLDC